MQKMKTVDINKNNEGKKYDVFPMGNRLLIRYENKEQKTDAGIIIPSIVSFKVGGEYKDGAMPVAIVVAKGPSCIEPIEIKDLVQFAPGMALKIWHPENKGDEIQYYVTHELNIETVLR